MANGTTIEQWHTLDKRTVEAAVQAAKCVSNFFDPTSKLFRVSIESGAVVDAAAADPNASTSLIGLTIARCSRRDWSLQGKAWSDLLTKVEQSRAALVKNDPVVLLPLRSFGVLPLFSTSYLAQEIPDCVGPDDLHKNIAYIIAIRRLFQEVFELSGRNERSVPRKTLHPFLLCNMLRGFRKLQAITTANPAVGETIGEALSNTSAILNAVKPSKRNGINEAEFEAALKLKTGDFSKYLDNSALPDLLKTAINHIEQAADNRVLSEIANYSRPNGRGVDPAALAYGMQILSDVHARNHSALLMQGLNLLLESISASHGLFAPGEPFHSDNKGRALFVPSIEVANIVASMALLFVRDLSKDQLASVVDKTSTMQALLQEKSNTIEATLDGRFAELQGWSSDRAPSSTRIDSWITVQVLEFFINRINLLRLAKRVFVFAGYNVRTHAECVPAWTDVQDPDEGEAASTKETIWRVIADPARRIAPVFLLYGPPGTSKTTLVTALAERQKWDLLSLSPSDFVADGLDKIEFRSRKIFSDLMRVDRCVILMDEMDSLFRDRRIFADEPGTIIEYVIPAFLPKLQELREYASNRDVAVFYVTNYHENIDGAISRGGRIDSHLIVLPYTAPARLRTAERLLSSSNASAPATSNLKDALEGMPCNHVYRDVEALVKLAISGESKERLAETAERIGIAPEVYDPDTRKDAFRELCSFLSRISAVPIDAPILSKDDALNYLRKTEREVRPHRRFTPWHQLIQKWIDQLR